MKYMNTGDNITKRKVGRPKKGHRIGKCLYLDLLTIQKLEDSVKEKTGVSVSSIVDELVDKYL